MQCSAVAQSSMEGEEDGKEGRGCERSTPLLHPPRTRPTSRMQPLHPSQHHHHHHHHHQWRILSNNNTQKTNNLKPRLALPCHALHHTINLKSLAAGKKKKKNNSHQDDEIKFPHPIYTLDTGAVCLPWFVAKFVHAAVQTDHVFSRALGADVDCRSESSPPGTRLRGSVPLWSHKWQVGQLRQQMQADTVKNHVACKASVCVIHHTMSMTRDDDGKANPHTHTALRVPHPPACHL